MRHRDDREAQRLASAAARSLGFTDEQQAAYVRGVVAAMEHGDLLYHHAGLVEARRAGWTPQSRSWSDKTAA